MRTGGGGAGRIDVLVGDLKPAKGADAARLFVTAERLRAADYGAGLATLPRDVEHEVTDLRGLIGESELAAARASGPVPGLDEAIGYARSTAIDG